MPSIQVILFDLGGTLLHYERPPEYTFDQLNARAIRALLGAVAKAGVRVPDPELAVRAIARMAAAMEARTRRSYHAGTAEHVIRDGLEAVNIRLPAAAWDAGMKAYYDVIAEAVTLAGPDVPEVLARLTRQGRGLGLVSNTFWSPAFHDADLARFGLLDYLPVRVYSSAAGFVKPHPSIYRQALDALDVAPAEAVFVGDRLAVDIAGPKKIGMRTVLIVSPYRDEQDPDIKPDARIHSLSELFALLEAWEAVLDAPIHGGPEDD